MNSCTTRFARAGWCSPLKRDGLSRASKPPAWSRCASAIPPRPPPDCHRNCLRVQLVTLTEALAPLIDKQELVRVEQHPASLRQAMRLYKGGNCLGFGGTRPAPVKPEVRTLDLLERLPRLGSQALCQEFGLLQHEWVVEQCQRLQCRQRGVAHRRVEVRIGRVEAVQERIRH